MPIPDFQTIMLPLLEYVSDGCEHTMAEAKDHLARHFSLNESELSEMLSSRRAPKFYNRAAWAKFYLAKAGLLESPRRGIFLITPLGKEVLQQKPERITISFLERFPDYVKFKQSPRKDQPSQPGHEPNDTPEEQLETAYQKIRDALADELLAKVKNGTPESFEHLVVELLLRMGYGGSRQEAGRAIGRSGDEGIDGVISEDRLGLDIIYLQAKKWDNTVGRPEIQKFVGALQGKRAKKGVFLTTGNFSNEAKQYVSMIDPKIVLIDGNDLMQLMIDYGLGVTSVGTYEFKRIDHDYFETD